MEKDKYMLGTVNNALKVMDLLAVRGEMSLAEISRALDLDKTAVFRLLYTLEKRDYVYKTPDGRHKLGAKFTNHSSLIDERRNIIELARPFMHQACVANRVSVQLGVLGSNGRVVIMHTEDSPSGYFISTRVGSTIVGYAASMGQVILARLPEEQRESLLRNYTYKNYTPTTITDPDRLRERLAVIRDQGWALDTNERYPGFGCLAAPILDRSGSCIAAVGFVLTEATINACFDELLTEILALSEQISRAVGYDL